MRLFKLTETSNRTTNMMYYYGFIITLACIIIIAMLILSRKGTNIDEMIDDDETNFTKYCDSVGVIWGNVPDPDNCGRFYFCHGQDRDPFLLICSENFCFNVSNRECERCSEIDCGTRPILNE